MAEDLPRSGRPSTSLTEVNIAKLKLPLRGTRFQFIEGIKENSRRKLKSIPEIRLKNVLMIGLFVGISLLSLEGPNLKVIK